jgi:hypothetical protein
LQKQRKNGSYTNVNPEDSEKAGEVNHGKDNYGRVRKGRVWATEF